MMTTLLLRDSCRQRKWVIKGLHTFLCHGVQGAVVGFSTANLITNLVTWTAHKDDVLLFYIETILLGFSIAFGIVIDTLSSLHKKTASGVSGSNNLLQSLKTAIAKVLVLLYVCFIIVAVIMVFTHATGWVKWVMVIGLGLGFFIPLGIVIIMEYIHLVEYMEADDMELVDLELDEQLEADLKAELKSKKAAATAQKDGKLSLIISWTE